MQKGIKKTRVNISLADDELNALKNLASMHGETLAGKARQLVLRAMELEEDIKLVELADKRNREKNFVSEEDFWN